MDSVISPNTGLHRDSLVFTFINMLVLRNKKLYLASRDPNLWKDVCEPGKPIGQEVQKGTGDTVTPRTVFWPTPEKAVSALGSEVKEGDTVYIYSPLTRPDPDSVYEPKPHESPLFSGLGEIWFLTNTRLSKPTSMKLGKVIRQKTLTYYDPRRHDFLWKDYELKSPVQTKMSKAVYLSPTDKGKELVLTGKVTDLYRTLSEANVPVGQYWVYKPIDSKIPISLDDFSWEGDRLVLRQSGKIEVIRGGGYKTL